jgi:hypothetical protein
VACIYWFVRQSDAPQMRNFIVHELELRRTLLLVQVLGEGNSTKVVAMTQPKHVLDHVDVLGSVSKQFHPTSVNVYHNIDIYHFLTSLSMEAASCTVRDGSTNQPEPERAHEEGDESQPLLTLQAPDEDSWKPPPRFFWIELAIMSNVFLYGFDGTITAATYAVISSEFDATNTAS